MGMRGPKPVSRNSLEGDARSWAAFLYTLRDGQPGHMQRVKWGPLQNTGSERWTKLRAGRGSIVLPANVPYRAAEALGPPIFIPVSDAARRLPAQMTAEEWCIFRPTMPAPALWELLKRARSVADVRRASKRIRRWETNELRGVGIYLPGTPPLRFTDALDQHAESVLIGKKLPTFAKTDRPTSDDKRIELISKVLAGARLGLAPITAAKLLSRWRLGKNWAEKPLREFIEWSEQEFAKRSIGGNVNVVAVNMKE
jgi:hypothetical protein